MKGKIFRSMLMLICVTIAATLILPYILPRDLTTMLWMVTALLFVGGLLALAQAEAITRSLTGALKDASLEDLEVQGLYEELRPLAAQMIDENRHIQKNLQKQNTELRREYEKQDRMRRDFTANVSHELKTPLTSISGYAELLRDGLVREEDRERFAGKIYDETQRLIALVEDILKLSQLEDGNQVRMERLPFDLTELCRRVIARLQDAAAVRCISIVFEGEAGNIVGVWKIVEEIAYNLLDNAIKYNRPYGSIHVSVHTRDDKLVLAVRDEGIGIEKDEQGRIFERFYRVDKSHSKEIGGTGLGLSIVKHGALYHDARIELDSVPGEGTEFRVLFQRAAQEQS